MLKVAKEFKDRAITFAIADIGGLRRDEFGLEGDKKMVATIKTDDGAKFGMQEEFR